MSESRKRGGEDLFGPFPKKSLASVKSLDSGVSSVEHITSLHQPAGGVKYPSIEAPEPKNASKVNQVQAKPVEPAQTTTTAIPFEPIQPFRLINHFAPVEPWNAHSRLTGECGSAIRRLQMNDIARMPLEVGIDSRRGRFELTPAMRRATQTEFVGYARPPTLKQTLARAREQHLINRANGTTERLPPWLEPYRVGAGNTRRIGN